MKGRIDHAYRALLTLSLAKERSLAPSNVEVWIDTAFDGQLVMSRALIASLGLKATSAVEAILADGSKVALATYVCYLDWFGEVRETEVIANDGQLPLLGTALLKGRRLIADYNTLELSVE